MLRITGLSLLLGAIMMAAGLKLFFLAPAPATTPADPILWNAADAAAGAINGIVEQKSLRLVVDRRGLAGFTLPLEPFNARDYGFIHLAIDQSDPEMKALVAWKTSADETKRHHYELENRSRASVWLSTAELRGWEGEITQIQLLFPGNDGESTLVHDFSLYPGGLLYLLKAIRSDWAGFVPWNRAAMNSYTGATNVSSFYPVPLVVSFLACSVLAYGLLLLLARRRTKFDFRVLSLLFLACWIVTDLAWQNRLINQLTDTHRIFAGKDPEEKRAVGPDAKLYQFIAAAKQHLESPNSRVLVITSDKYIGLRSAYYFYPHNALYRMHGRELPANYYLRSGDYVALLKPSVVQYFPRRQLLAMPNSATLDAQLLYSDKNGKLVRLN